MLNSLLKFLSELVEFFLSMKVLTARNISLLAGLWSLELLTLLTHDYYLLMLFRRLAASRSGFALLNELELELDYSRSSYSLEKTLELRDNADLFVAKSSRVAFSFLSLCFCFLVRISNSLSYLSLML